MRHRGGRCQCDTLMTRFVLKGRSDDPQLTWDIPFGDGGMMPTRTHGMDADTPVNLEMMVSPRVGSEATLQNLKWVDFSPARLPGVQHALLRKYQTVSPW